MYYKGHLAANKHSFNLKGYGFTIAKGRHVLGVYGNKAKHFFRVFETSEAHAAIYQQSARLKGM